MKVSISRTTDIAAILILNDLIFYEEPLNVSCNTFHWTARDCSTGEPVAFCSVSDIGHGILYFTRCGVLPDYRGRGLQRRLIRVRERFAKRNGFKTIITYVKNDNYSSLISLVKSGYELYTPEYDYAGEGFTYLRKKL